MGVCLRSNPTFGINPVIELKLNLTELTNLPFEGKVGSEFEMLELELNTMMNLAMKSSYQG